ncbi:MAG TPA: DUF4384 domain-containing protein [Pyrinomonadaceae bacterium]|nr:DUF4384 domain-containing protein [Pyrinomonadaceae bacterium]
MKVKAFICALVMASLAGLGTVAALTQDQEEDVRGAFLTTRPKPADKKGNETARPNRRRPRAQTVKPSATPGSGTTTGATPKADPNKVTPQKLGVGLTLLSRDSLGLTVRTDPTRTFRKGDRVRVLLETNTDGYLYIFNTTNSGKPVMIYPNKELDEGGNYLQAHVPFEIPSSTAGEERLRWLVFDEFAGNERLYFVFTREPLPGIPLEDDLVAFCSDAKNTCPIQPSAELWAQLEKELDEPLRRDATNKYGKAQTQPEREAIERGLGLSKEEPEPSLIMMSASAKSGTLVTVLDLVHK